MSNPTTKPRNVAEKGIDIFREKEIVEFSEKVLGYVKHQANIFVLLEDVLLTRRAEYHGLARG